MARERTANGKRGESKRRTPFLKLISLQPSPGTFTRAARLLPVRLPAPRPADSPLIWSPAARPLLLTALSFLGRPSSPAWPAPAAT